MLENAKIDLKEHDLLKSESGLDICSQANIGDLSVKFGADATIEQVEQFEEVLDNKSLNLVPALDPYCVKHKVNNGLYFRALFMPKDMLITGRLHKEGYIDVMVSGDVTVESFLADGTKESADRYTGLNIFEGVPGRKRVLYTHADTLWFTVDHTKAKELKDALDDATVVKSKDYRKCLDEVKI